MTRLHQLSGLGQSVWIDFLSRDLLESGGLARAIDEDAVVGVTSNPTILEKALAHGDTYDSQIRQARDVDLEHLFLDRALCSRIRFTEWPHENQTLTRFQG